MSLFQEQRDAFGQGTYNPFENPAVPLASVGLDQVFGNLSSTDAGESVTEEKAFCLPIFWRCVQLMTTVIAGCPIRTWDGPDRTEVFPRILQINNPNTLYTQYELWELITAHLCTWGNAYVRKVRNTMDTIVDLRPINPMLVTVKLDDGGNKIFEVKRVRKNGTIDPLAKPEVLTTFECMHIPGMGYDGLKGLAPVQLAKRTLGTAMAGDKLAAKFFSKGTILSGVVKIEAPLASQEQADKIRNKWLMRHSGTGHAAEVAVLDAGAEFQPLTIPPDSLQFLESRRWETTEIARWFGIPPHLVGDVEKSTSWGTGIEQQNTGFVSYTVSGWTRRMEQRVTREITGGTKNPNVYSEFDLDRLLRGDQAERYAAYTAGINGGWLLRNEARAAENKPAIPGLDEPLMPLNMQTVKQADEAADNASKMAEKTLTAPTPDPNADPNSSDDDETDSNDADS